MTTRRRQDVTMAAAANDIINEWWNKTDTNRERRGNSSHTHAHAHPSLDIKYIADGKKQSTRNLNFVFLALAYRGLDTQNVDMGKWFSWHSRRRRVRRSSVLWLQMTNHNIRTIRAEKGRNKTNSNKKPEWQKQPDGQKELFTITVSVKISALLSQVGKTQWNGIKNFLLFVHFRWGWEGAVGRGWGAATTR